MSSMFASLEEMAATERATRVAAAAETPQPWRPMDSAPRDGTLIDVLFDVPSAEPHAAEFYAAGSTCNSSPADPVIENVAFVNGSFAPVVSAEDAKIVAALKGGWGTVDSGSVCHGILSVNLTAWRPAAYPFIES